MKNIVIYTKDYCPYCIKAKALLNQLGQKYTEIDLIIHPEKREEMIHQANGRTTVPQVFVEGQHVGGCDDLHALYSAGKLQKMLDI